MTTDPTLTRMLARQRNSGDARQSEAYVWLRLRFEKLVPTLRNKPGWRVVAEEMAADGIKGGRGKPLTGRAVMRIWSRVCQAVAADEAWRMNAARSAMQEGELAQKPRNRELERGANADRPPPVVRAPAPRLPVPHYPSPPTKPPAQSTLHSRPDAPPTASGATQTPEEMLADLKTTIKRRSRYF